MGLFSRPKKPQKVTAKVEVRTDKSYKMYVYDPSPLKGMRAGSTFEAEYVARKTKLKSATGKTQTVPGAFFVGKVAMGGTFSDWLNDQLAQQGKRVTVTCRFDGLAPEGWADVRFYLPE